MGKARRVKEAPVSKTENKILEYEQFKEEKSQRLQILFAGT